MDTHVIKTRNTVNISQNLESFESSLSSSSSFETIRTFVEMKIKKILATANERWRKRDLSPNKISKPGRLDIPISFHMNNCI
jgi:hypothetical protein